MKQIKRSYTRSARLLFAALLLLMVAGSVYDFQISSFLYPGKESSFGQFFAAFGELPAFLALICAGVLLFRHRGCLRKDWNVLFLIGAFGLVLGGIFLAVHEATDNVPAMPSWVPLLVTVFFAAHLLGSTSSCDERRAGEDGHPLCTDAHLCVRRDDAAHQYYQGTLGQGQNAAHRLDGERQLFYAVVEGGQRRSRTGWLPRAFLPTSSAPSRPAIRPAPPAQCSLRCCRRSRSSLSGKEKRLGLLGCLWTAIVAFSRLRMGAHFLTDVTMAWLVTLGLTVLGVYLFYFNKKFFQFVWNLISEREEQSYEQE